MADRHSDNDDDNAPRRGWLGVRASSLRTVAVVAAGCGATHVLVDLLLRGNTTVQALVPKDRLYLPAK